MERQVLTVKDVAEQLGIGINQAYSACERGQIPTVRFGRRWLIPKPAFQQWLEFSGIEGQDSGGRHERKI